MHAGLALALVAGLTAAWAEPAPVPLAPPVEPPPPVTEPSPVAVPEEARAACDAAWAAFLARGQPTPLAHGLVDEACAALPAAARPCLDTIGGPPRAGCAESDRAMPAWVRRNVLQAMRAAPSVGDAWRRPGEAWHVVGAQAALGSLLLAVCVLAQLAASSRQRAILADVEPGRRALALVALALVGLASVVSWISAPHGAWHSNQHGLDRLVALLEGEPGRTVGISELHGVGWFVVVRPLAWLLGDPFAAMLVLSSVSSWLLFLLARALLGSPGALVAVAWHAWAPIHLRLAVTDDMYVPVEVVQHLGLLSAVAWVRAGGWGWFALAAGWTTLAMLGRMEAIAFAPWTVVLLVAHLKPVRLVEAVRSPWAWAVLVACVASFVPRVVEVVDQLDSLGSMARPSPAWRDVRAWVPLLVIPVWAALAARIPAVGARLGAGVVAVDSAAILGGGALVGVVALSARLARAGFDVGPYHALLDPRWSAVGLPVLAGLGVALGAAHGRAALGSWVVLAGFPAMQVVARAHDCISTYLRTASGGLWPMALAAGLVAGRRPGLALALAACGVVSGASRPDVLTARFDKQELWDLVVAAREALPERALVAVLDPEDVPSEAASLGWNTGRGHPWRWLGSGGERLVVGLDRLSAWDRFDGPRYWLRTPSCYGLVSDLGALRAWRDGVLVEMRPTFRSSLSDGPTTWPADATPYLAHEDARCRAIPERYVLEPVVSWTFRTRRSGSEYEQLFHPEPTVGLYRIVGLR